MGPQAGRVPIMNRRSLLSIRLQSWLCGARRETVIYDVCYTQCVRRDGEARVRACAGRKERRIDDIQIAYAMNAISLVENTCFRIVAKAACPAHVWPVDFIGRGQKHEPLIPHYLPDLLAHNAYALNQFFGVMVFDQRCARS